MKIAIADMAADCFPDNVSFDGFDAESTDRITALVMEKIKDEPRCRRYVVRKVVSTILIAAVLVSLLTVTACALGLFKLNKNLITDDYVPHGRWIERDDTGQIIRIQDLDYPDANLFFTFDGDIMPHYIEFKPGWLPMEGSGWTKDGWYSCYGNNGDSDLEQVPYKIEVSYAIPGYQFVLMFKSKIVEETTWDDYEVTKLINHNPYWGDDNYVLMFNPEYGYMIRVAGGLSMETLEKIAQDLEVRILDEEVEYNPDYNIGIINIGRG